MATPLDDFGSTVAGAYPDLRAIAAAYLSRERRFHTLGPTELVHEGILKQFPNGEYSELTPADFMNRIAHAMRLVLVDHARRRNALKRGGSAATTILDESLLAYEKSAIDVLALDEALDRLERLDRELALIVELRFFAGLTEIEIARELDISEQRRARVAFCAAVARPGTWWWRLVVHAERWQRLRSIVESALELPASSRPTMLQRDCAGDLELLAEAQSLLCLSHVSDTLLDPPNPGIGGAVALAAIASHGLGRRYGQYQATCLLSAGMNGAVFKGVVDAGLRTVAIKLLPQRMGPELSRRFDRECRVLADLNHPGICQFLQDGVTDDGARFIVMEFIDGPAIDDYCRSRPLSERIELLRTVCSAVAHAHSRGVIHRDLKPSNILVTSDGQPKVIDFGIARLANSNGAETTLHTDPGRLIGTLPYMSPEQIAGDPMKIDARTDIYALGVLLFQLASGRLPFDLSGRALPLAARLISESEPIRLASLGRQFRGDLDTIASKAMEKNPARRYQSVAELEADLGRFLAHQEIVAQQPGIAYRARKFTRRHAAVSVAVAAVFLILVVSITAVSMALVRSRRDAARARAVSSFLQEVLVSVNPYRLPSGPPAQEMNGDMRIARLIDDAAARLDSGWIEDPRTEADLRHSLGLTYAGLNQNDHGAQQLVEAVRLRTTCFGPSAPATLEAKSALGSVLSEIGRSDDAEQLLDAAADGLQQQLGVADERTFSAIFERASFRVLHHQFEEALTDANCMLAAESQRGETYRSALAGAIKAIAVISRGDVATGIPLGREAMASLARTGCRNHRMAGVCAGTLAMACELSSLPDDAELYYREAHASYLRLLGPDDPRTAEFAQSLGAMLLRRERYAEAESMLAAALAPLDKEYGATNLLTRRASTDLALALRGQGRLNEALAVLEKSMETCTRDLGAEHAGTFRIMGWIAALRCDQGRFQEAEPLARHAYVGLAGSREFVNDERLMVADTLAAALNGLQRYDEAKEIVEAALATWHEQKFQDRVVPVLLHLREGEALLGLGRRHEAIKSLEDSVERLTTIRGPSADITCRAQDLLLKASLR